jgi:pyruvate formate lyase activating enzyme
MHTALYFEKLNDSKVQCTLCPHGCVLIPQQTGICRVRSNNNGVLITENYGKISSIHLDPIEKKPLYHFFPGSKILSMGSVGCNLQCNFCQNAEISQTGINDFSWAKDYTVHEIVIQALEIPDNIGIAFTYNEPVIFFEYMLDIARLSKRNGLNNVMVSNGFIKEGPLKELLPWMDAFNIDLKAFTDEFYRKQTRSKLDPVKRCLQLIRESGKHLEITNLVIPGLNDEEKNFAAMVQWLAEVLGKDTVLHLSRYFPRYKATQPITNSNTLLRFKNIAIQKLSYVYVGNTEPTENSNDTVCPKCKTSLIQRYGYHVVLKSISPEGECLNCGQKIVIR